MSPGGEENTPTVMVVDKMFFDPSVFVVCAEALPAASRPVSRTAHPRAATPSAQCPSARPGSNATDTRRMQALRKRPWYPRRRSVEADSRCLDGGATPDKSVGRESDSAPQGEEGREPGDQPDRYPLSRGMTRPGGHSEGLGSARLGSARLGSARLGS